MNIYMAELIGTAMLVLLGNGVVANVVLKGTKGNQAGWLAISAGWGLAVYVAVACAEQFSGAHINPAVTVGLAAAGKFAWSRVPGYLAAQLVGGALGAVGVFVTYRLHYALSDDADAKLATFCTAPAIRHWPANLFSESIATFVLVFAVLLFAEPKMPVGSETLAVPFGLGAGSDARRLARVFHRTFVRWHNGICNQSRAGLEPANDACCADDSGQTRQRLELCLDSCRRAIVRGGARRGTVSIHGLLLAITVARRSGSRALINTDLKRTQWEQSRGNVSGVWLDGAVAGRMMR